MIPFKCYQYTGKEKIIFTVQQLHYSYLNFSKPQLTGCFFTELSKYLKYKKDVELRKSKQVQKALLKAEMTSTTDGKDPSLTFITFSSNFSSQAKKKRYNNSIYARKPVLDITETCEKLKNNINSATIIEQSANSQVRHYLKSLSRKKPLEKTINKLKDNYGQAQKKSKQKTDEYTEKINVAVVESTAKKDECKKPVNYHIKLLESGWIQDSTGNWVKDPNVEFDSDEDEPPSF